MHKTQYQPQQNSNNQVDVTQQLQKLCRTSSEWRTNRFRISTTENEITFANVRHLNTMIFTGKVII